MKAVISWLVLFTVVCGFLIYNINNPNNGIVGLEGYSEGVAFCGHEYKWVIHAADAHVWREHGNTFVINQGHLHDPEVAKLKQLAKEQCAQLEGDK